MQHKWCPLCLGILCIIVSVSLINYDFSIFFSGKDVRKANCPVCMNILDRIYGVDPLTFSDVLRTLDFVSQRFWFEKRYALG